MEQMRDFDFVQGFHDVLYAIAGLAADMTSGLPITVVAGLVATQTTIASLTVNIASGRIYQFAAADSTTDGSIAQDLTVIVQQGYNGGQALTFLPPSAGQSQWNLIQAQFSQVDAVRSGDPNGGVVPFYNPANSTQPTLNSINTVRQGLCVLQVITGSAATTGSEVPPSPTSGWVPLYMIDLAGGQTAVTTSQIIKCAPSVGTGVSTSYPYAPFLAGFLASHHSGTAGQAPQIKLGSEVQGILPYANMSPVPQLLNANLTLYVNASTGNDSNSGLTAATPFKTLQAAVNSIYHNYDFNGYGATVSVANGTYTSGVQIIGLPTGLSAPISFVGNTAAPASCAITVSSGTYPTGNCFFVTQGAQVNLSGFQFSATSTSTGNGWCLYAWMGGIINFGTVIFSTSGNGHMIAQNGGSIFSSQTLGYAYTINGSAPVHMESDAGGVMSINSSVVTLTGTPAFSAAFADAGRCSTMQAIGATFSGAATGVKGYIYLNATCTTGSSGNTSFFPGVTLISTATGGQFS